MKRRDRLFIGAVLLVLLIFLLSHRLRQHAALRLSPDSNDPTRISLVSGTPSNLDWPSPHSTELPSPGPSVLDYPYSKSWAPKITSVEANPQIDLLFVQVDKFEFGCSEFSTAPNVHAICLDEEQYLQLHIEFLCKRWSCSEENKNILYDYLNANKEQDINNSFFRVLRNGIFRRWIDPATTIWGWCDLDTFWGNFSRAFPWDIAHDFDVLAPAHQSDHSQQILLFTRGHMAFFRNSPEVLEHFLAYPKFASLSAYLALPLTLIDAEESEFSHYIFSEECAFTFVVFEGMVHSWDTVLVSSSGVFYTSSVRREDFAHLEPHKQEQKRVALLTLVHPTNRSRIVPTFSTADDHKSNVPNSNFDFGSTGPAEYPSRVLTSGDSYSGSLWFHPRYATFVETDWPPWPPTQSPSSSEHHISVSYPPKAYFLRRTPNAPIVQRIEPRERYLLWDDEGSDDALAVDECLYLHWQEEKRQPWFERIPAHGLRPGQTFVQFHNDEVEIWDETGHIVHSTRES